MHDIVNQFSPDYAKADCGRNYRCLRTSSVELERDLPRINELAESGHVQMLQIDCRKEKNISALMSIVNIEYVVLLSDDPLSLPTPSTGSCNLKALSCHSKQFRSDSFPEIAFLNIHGLDFSQSNFTNATKLRRLFVSDFQAKDHMIQLEAASSLVELELFRSTSLERIDVVSALHELRRLSLARLRKVTSLTPIEKLSRLRNLSIERIKNIESYRPISKLKDLEVLMIVDSAQIDFLSEEQIESLQRFNVFGTERVAPHAPA